MKMAKVVNPSFHKAIMKLSNQDLPIKTAKSVLSILRKVKDETDKYHQQRIKLLTEHAEKDADGKPQLDENDNFVIKEDSKEVLNTELVAMMGKSVKLTKLKSADMSDARLTAQEFSLLEDIIS